MASYTGDHQMDSFWLAHVKSRKQNTDRPLALSNLPVRLRSTHASAGSGEFNGT